MTLSEPEDLIKPWDRLYSLILCRLVSIGIWNSFIHKLSQEENYVPLYMLRVPCLKETLFSVYVSSEYN